MIVKGGFVHVAFALIKRITIDKMNTNRANRANCTNLWLEMLGVIISEMWWDEKVLVIEG